jgi:broad specificity phosphatase PhoE
MLRLPIDRLECPLVEPSQRVCPHWSLVVLHQAAREVLYMGLEAHRKLKQCAQCSDRDIAYISKITTVGPMRSLTATKRVCFVRHGQGAHNRSIKNWGMVDPELTPEGEQQVAELNRKMQPYLSDVELIVVSPLTRAMQTATGGLAGCSAPYALLPILRERLGAPCDTGRTKSELVRCFPRILSWEGIDEMPEVWWSTETEYDLLERVDLLKAWISARPEQVIAVVGHGGLIQRILGYHLHNCGFEWVNWHTTPSDG